MSVCENCGHRMTTTTHPFTCPECGYYNEEDYPSGFCTKSDDDVEYGDYIETW